MTSCSEWSVAEWLTSFGMKELTPKFLEHGYETEKLCSKLQAEDMEAMCINNPMHLEVIYTQSEMLRKKREEKTAVANGQAPAFVPKPFESTDGTSPNLHIVKNKVRKSPVVQQRKIPEKVHVPPPESQRTFAGYTKLQLKLRIKEEIRKEHIVLSEPPYCLEDGSANEELLQKLAEDYAERFNLESLTVYYALKDVWRFTANERSEIATPKSGELKKVRKTPDTSQPPPPELNAYSEPFDNKPQSPVKPVGKPAKKVSAISGSVSPKNPPASFQAISELPGTYADPFDALPQITKDSPPSAELKRRQPILASPKPMNTSPGKSRDDSNIKWKFTPSPMNKTHSFTLPPPGSPSISSSSSEESPKKSPRARRFWSPFRRRKNASSSTSQSPQHQQDLSAPQPVMHGSMEDLPKQKSPARFRQSSSQNRLSRQSLPGALSGLPRVPTDSGLISDSASEDSPVPAKKLGGSCGMLIDSGHDTPPIAGAGSSPTGSVGEERDRVVSRVKALAIKRSNSDFELSNVVELYVEGQDRPFRFKKAQSTDELDKDESSAADGSGKKKKTSNIISRLFKPKSRKDKLKAAGNKSKSQSVSDDLITPSRSMPNVSRAVTAVIHSEYTEVFDGDVRGKVTKTPSPSPSPRVPQRNRPHTTKPHRTTSTHSPKTSPPTHHRLMVKSDSIGSSEMTIHSIPSSRDNDDDATIELGVPVAAAPSSVCHSHAELEEEEDFGDVFQSSDAEKSPERDASQTRTDGSGSASSKDGQRPISIVRTCSGNKPPLAPKPVIARERLTSGGSLKRASRTSVGSSTSSSPSHIFSPMEGHVGGSKPPPKPSRSKSRSFKSPSPSSSDSRSGEESHQPGVGQLPHLVVEAAEATSPSPAATSPPPAGEEVLTVVNQRRQRWPSGSNPPPKPPKPLNLKGSVSLPRHLKPEISPALLHSVEKKLAEEGVDLSQAPYTNQLGEYNIPSGLVSRYVNEMDYSSNEIALTLEDIRRRLLHKHNQKYVPFVGSWKDHSSLDRSSVKAFLTSVGLPMYGSVFEEYGYSSVELIQSASPEQLFILPLTDRHRQLLSKAVLSL